MSTSARGVGVTKAELVVKSDDLTLAGLEELVGVRSAPGGHSIGDVRRIGKQPLNWSSWVMGLDLDPAVHAGVYGLDSAIGALPDELAASLAAAAEAGCDVSLSVVQTLTCDERWDHGFFLSAASLRWLVAAGAKLDLDQYTERRRWIDRLKARFVAG